MWLTEAALGTGPLEPLAAAALHCLSSLLLNTEVFEQTVSSTPLAKLFADSQDDLPLNAYITLVDQVPLHA